MTLNIIMKLGIKVERKKRKSRFDEGFALSVPTKSKFERDNVSDGSRKGHYSEERHGKEQEVRMIQSQRMPESEMYGYEKEYMQKEGLHRSPVGASMQLKDKLDRSPLRIRGQ